MDRESYLIALDKLVARKHRLGLASLIADVRLLRGQLPNRTDVPDNVVIHLPAIAILGRRICPIMPDHPLRKARTWQDSKTLCQREAKDAWPWLIAVDRALTHMHKHMAKTAPNRFLSGWVPDNPRVRQIKEEALAGADVVTLQRLLRLVLMRERELASGMARPKPITPGLIWQDMPALEEIRAVIERFWAVYADPGLVAGVRGRSAQEALIAV